MSPYLHSNGLNLYAMFYEVRRRLAEVSASYWVDLELFNWLNQGQIDIATKSRCLKKNVTVTTVASTQEYDLKDNSFADIIDVSEDGVSFKVAGSNWNRLYYTTKYKLNKNYPSWRSTAAGVPTDYYYDKASKTIGLYPKPNTSNTGAYLLVEGVYLPKILAAGTASAGSSTTMGMAAGSSTQGYPAETADYYNGLWIEIYSGTGAGEKAQITDYAGGTLTVAFTSTPDTTSVYGMLPEIPESAHHLMILYALGRAWSKGGIRTTLGESFMQQYYAELGQFIGEHLETDDEEIVRDTYR